MSSYNNNLESGLVQKRFDTVQRYENFRQKMSPGTLVRANVRIAVSLNLPQRFLKEIKIGYVMPDDILMFLNTLDEGEDTSSATYTEGIPLRRVRMLRWLHKERIVYATFQEGSGDVEILPENSVGGNKERSGKPNGSK